MMILLVSLLFTTLVYSAFNTQLQIKGDAIVRSEQIMRITKLSISQTLNGAYETYSSKYEKDTTSLYVILPASSSMVYEVEVTNKNNLRVFILDEIVHLVKNNDDVSVEYGIKVGDYIKNGSTEVFTISLINKTSSTQNLTLITHFNFSPVELLPLETNFLSSYDSGDFSEQAEGILFEFNVKNLNNFSVNYTITSSDKRYLIVDEDTNDNKFQIAANGTATHKVRVKLRNNVVYEKLIDNLKLMVKTTSPGSTTSIIKTVVLSLPNNFNTYILNSLPIHDSPQNFTAMEATNGYLYRINEMTESSYTYYFRGVIDNNYVSLAGQLWRIVRIDSKGNIRLVLNNNVDPATQFYSKYVAGEVQNIDEAINILDYKKSDIRKAVEDWYDKNIATNEDSKYVTTSNFCVDLSYQDAMDTQFEHTVYYFTPYIHVGVDANSFKPDFSCKIENVFQSNVGLLSAEEVLAAGGYWENVNDKYYLYDPTRHYASQASWTISASYYSQSEKQAGVIVFNQEGRGLFDWMQGGNLTQFYGFRPVISINGKLKAAGEGTIDNPFQIINQ